MRIAPFLDQGVKGFECGLDSILIDFIKTPELETSFNVAEIGPSSVSVRFPHLVSTMSDISTLQLAPVALQ